MDILKLASEMDLSCIKAYKLDALKSVRKTDESRNLGMAHNHSEAIETPTEDPCHATIDGSSTSVDEGNSTTTVVHSGKEHADLHPFLSSY
jgi:hypothetical protein